MTAAQALIDVIAAPRDAMAAELVRYSLVRAFSAAQLAGRQAHAQHDATSIRIFINPLDSDLPLLESSLQQASKVIVLGIMADSFAERLGMRTSGLPGYTDGWDHCTPARPRADSQSRAVIRYRKLPDGLECPLDSRPLLRFDFADEWNNLGYGHVRTDGSIWSLACIGELTAAHARSLADVIVDGEKRSVYAALIESDGAAVLWLNRAVGLPDSHEFRLVETFLANYRPDELPCLPVLREVPYGYDAAVTMRLDCDEAVASARPLFELYRERGVPFSLAIRTGQPLGADDLSLMRDVLDNGGALLSHSINHKPNWGVDAHDVELEASGSQRWMLDNVAGLDSVDFAVSPFHQNPDYAVSALASVFRGFVGGIISNDPQYLLARGGQLPGAGDMVSHSQQCMLHGDCLQESGSNPLQVYESAARSAVDCGALFGYLDHPFSDYHYGWRSEDERLDSHSDWLDHLQAYGKVMFLNERQALQRIHSKTRIRIWQSGGVVQSDVGGAEPAHAFCCEYRGELVELVA